jgi:hypothetical protein
MTDSNTGKEENNLPWRRFPAMEKLGEQRQLDAMMASIEATCQALDTARSAGSPAERDRAQLALAAYGRLLQLIGEIQAEAAKAAATSGVAGR